MRPSLLLLRNSLLLSLGLAGCPGDDKGTTTTDSGDTAACDTASDTGDCGADVFDPSPRPCEGGETLMQDSDDGPVPTGWEQCADGRVHRAAQETCTLLTDATGTCPEDGCLTDCIEAEHGYCNEFPSDSETCDCNYVPESDADCDGGAAWCEGVLGFCMNAWCDTDADCDDGYLCAVTFRRGICGEHEYSQACESALDTCRTDEDCASAYYEDADGNGHWFQCDYDGTRHTCVEGPNADCGRPFTVDGQARVAAPISRADWSLGGRGDGDAPSAADAAVLAAYWLRIAGLEHASVASFARFTLHLMALGAPPDLLLDSQRAAADEVVHARLCYGLARRFGGVAQGPGPLDLTGALGAASPAEILRALVVEGCVGETLAAAEARWAAEQATDAEVRDVLTRIAEDEARHAALAWRALRWMVQVLDPGLAPVARAALAEAMTVAVSVAPGPDLARWGRPAPERAAALRREATELILRPLVQALLSSPAAARGAHDVSPGPAASEPAQRPRPLGLRRGASQETIV